MAGPLLAFASSVAGGVLHSVIDAALAPITNKFIYTANAQNPTSIPSIETCINAWMTGWMSPLLARNIAAMSGAYLPLEADDPGIAGQSQFDQTVRIAWANVVQSRQAVLSPQDTLELWVRGLIDDEEADKWLGRSAVIDTRMIELLKQLELVIPQKADIVPAWQHGLITRDEAFELLRKRGIDLVQFETFWRADSITVKPEAAVEFGKRLGLDRDGINKLLLRSGVFDTDEAAKFQTLYQKLPSRADVQLWLMRNVFDDQYVKDFRLDEGFEERFWSRFSTVLTAGGWSHDYSYLDYAAHWQIPAVSQLAEMVQRLRPGSVSPELEFGVDDFLRVLAEQDVAPYYRDRLLAISYRPLPIRFLRAAYQTNALSHQGVSEAYQDQGYAKVTADFMAETERIIKARARAAAGRGWTPQAIARAVISGQMDPQNAPLLMQELGFTVAETTAMLKRAQAEYAGRFVTAGVSRVVSGTARAVLRGYTVGTVSAPQALQTLISLGWRADSAQAVLSAAELDVKTSQVVRATAAVRRAFLKGEIDATGALSLLSRAGMDPARAAPQVAAWQLELTPVRRHVSAGAIRKGILAGLLSVDAARQALANLGYSDPDAALLVSEMTYDLREQQVKLRKAADKNRVSAARLYDQLLANNASLERKIRSKLRTVTPVAKLQAWFKSGLIDEVYFHHRLSQMGFDSDTIERYLLDAIAKQSKSSKGPPPAASGNGTAAPPGA